MTKALTFNDGVWTAVEYLILTRGSPTFAKELIVLAGITKEQVYAMMKRTGYRTRELKRTLKNEDVWE